MARVPSLFARPSFTAVMDSVTPPPALTVTGDLPNYETNEPYEGRAQINNAIGKCSLVVLASDLPPGAQVFVDNFTQEVVVSWPEYTGVPSTALLNGSFEDGANPWKYGKGWSRSTDPGYDGTACAKFADASGRDLRLQGGLVPADPGDSITLSCQVQQGASRAGNTGAGVSLSWYDEDRTRLSESKGNVVDSGSGGAWHPSTVTATAPASTAFVSPDALAFRVGENKPLWVDSFSWNHGVVGGANSEATFTVTVRVRDSAGRTADYSGTIEYQSPGLSGYIIGPITLGGSVGYIRTADPNNWAGATLEPLPDPLFENRCSFQYENGLLFCIPNDSGYLTQVSSDGGLTWTPTNVTLTVASADPASGIYWNGSYYWRHSLYSPDGINWSTIPNHPRPGHTSYYTMARADGMVWLGFTSGGAVGGYRSYDNGATWTFFGAPYGYALWGPFYAYDGTTRMWSLNTGDGSAATNTDFASVSAGSNGSGAGLVYLPGGVWLGQRNSTPYVQRNTGMSNTWTTVHTASANVSYGRHLFVEYGGDLYMITIVSGFALSVLKSTDTGLTWTAVTSIPSTAVSSHVCLIHLSPL